MSLFPHFHFAGSRPTHAPRCRGWRAAARAAMGLIALQAFAGFAAAATVIFQEGVSPTIGYGHLAQDFRGSGATNNGTDTLVGMQVGGVLQIRTVLSFDLSMIPAGAVIDSLNLVMTVNNLGNGTISGLGAIEVHEVIPNALATNNLVDGQVTWTTWKTGSNWTTAGGDFGILLTSALIVDGDADNQIDNGEKATFASSAAFITAAQNAFNAGLPLELILLSPTAEGAVSSNFARFGSDTAATTSNRPQLTIDYTPAPEPSAMAMLAVTAVGMLSRRIRQRRPLHLGKL